MRYSLNIVEADLQLLVSHLSQGDHVEQAAYLLCRPSKTNECVTLLVQQVIPVLGSEIAEQSSVHMKISSRSYTRALKRADEKGCSFVFVHSHPSGYRSHSSQDDLEERELFKTAYIRVHHDVVHASVVFVGAEPTSARVWLEDGNIVSMDRIRVVGRRWRYWFFGDRPARDLQFFDRQIRAFGADVQRLLSELKVGIVGVGGTGSAVAEQLIRLGVGSCVLADGERFESTNVNRVYGSRAIDDSIAKVKLTERMAADIGLGTKTFLVTKPVTFQSAMQAFKDCDVVFCCTDDEWGRSLLSRFAVYYLTPVIDMGVKIDSVDGHINSIQGRVTTLQPGAPCLYCRDRIDPNRVRGESVRALDPTSAIELEREGYIPELGDSAPAVVPFTTMVASVAVSEFLHRLTGFLGSERESTEVILRVDDTQMRTNSKRARAGCFCDEKSTRGRGDCRPLMDVTWRPE